MQQATKFARAAAIGAALALMAAGFAWSAAAAPVMVNATPEAALPGKFVWFDAVTDDLAASEAFYGAVFDWSFRSIGSGDNRYTLIQNRGRSIGGGPCRRCHLQRDANICPGSSALFSPCGHIAIRK